MDARWSGVRMQREQLGLELELELNSHGGVRMGFRGL